LAGYTAGRGPTPKGAVATRGIRLLDRVIIRGGEFRIAQQSEVTVEGQDPWLPADGSRD
jgi:hypothetical protein